MSMFAIMALQISLIIPVKHFLVIIFKVFFKEKKIGNNNILKEEKDYT